jgi:ribonuclease T2
LRWSTTHGGGACKPTTCNCSEFTFVVRLFAVVALLAVCAGPALARGNKAGVFDYYVLSLSWSPSFCGTPAGKDSPTQCTPGRRFAFVIHGLWPQFKDGWPEFCATEEVWVPEQQIDAMMDIMPSRKLIIHEWRKHGSCSGLSQASYFRAIRILRERLRIPARYLSPATEIRSTPQQLVRDFVLSNKNLTAEMISVQCGNARDTGRLSELRICLDRKGEFAPCGRNEARHCQAKQLIMPEVR